MHKMLNNNVPEYLSSLVPDSLGTRTDVNIRNHGNVRNVFCRIEKYKTSFVPNTIELWNELDEETRQIDNIDEFKRKLIPAKPRNVLFCHGQRTINIIHAQMRMSCSNLKSDLKSLHVIDDATCICGNAVEDCFHFFFECPLYDNQRQKLFADVNNICTVNLDVLLFGENEMDLVTNKQIFESVHEFIKSTGRF